LSSLLPYKLVVPLLVHTRLKKTLYSVSGKKDQNAFCSISYNTPVTLMKFGTPFPVCTV